MKNLVYEQTFDEERSLYNIKDTEVLNCKFEGPADGESVLKRVQKFFRKQMFFFRSAIQCGTQKNSC